MRNYIYGIALVLTACGGSDWLTGPGTPVELTHDSLEGRWVNVLVVHPLVADPSIQYRFEHSTEVGSILEFDGAGGVDHARVAPDATANLPRTYTINGDTLTLSFDYVAEVTTTRLVLTLEGIAHDYDEDGDREEAVQVSTYRKARD